MAGVLLAAGSGSRFRGSGHKLLANVGAASVFELSLTALLGAELDESIVVVGAVDLSEILLKARGAVTVIENPNWARGQATSMAATLDYLGSSRHDAAVFGLADQPGVTATAWRQVANAGSSLARACYGGQHGHPVRISRSLWNEISRDGDEGARSLLRGRASEVQEVPCVGRHDDIDTVEDLDTWN